MSTGRKDPKSRRGQRLTNPSALNGNSKDIGWSTRVTKGYALPKNSCSFISSKHFSTIAKGSILSPVLLIWVYPLATEWWVDVIRLFYYIKPFGTEGLELIWKNIVPDTQRIKTHSGFGEKNNDYRSRGENVYIGDKTMASH